MVRQLSVRILYFYYNDINNGVNKPMIRYSVVGSVAAALQSVRHYDHRRRS